jgi:Protein of unknown function (DUF1566)
MKWNAKIALNLLHVVAMVIGAQSPTNDHRSTPETQARGYWVDPSTGLVWPEKDNGRNVSYHKAVKYCHNLQLGGFPDWRLPTIDELQGIFDRKAEAPGINPPSHWHPAEAWTYHVKGSLFLSGKVWGSTPALNPSGEVSGYQWYFVFNDGSLAGGRRDRDSTGYFEHVSMPALCVRHPGR